MAELGPRLLRQGGTHFRDDRIAVEPALLERRLPVDAQRHLGLVHRTRTAPEADAARPRPERPRLRVRAAAGDLPGRAVAAPDRHEALLAPAAPGARGPLPQ